MRMDRFYEVAGKYSRNCERQNVTEYQSKHVKNYKGSGYSGLNSYLRSGKTGGQYKEFIDALDTAIYSNECAVEAQIFRGIRWNGSYKVGDIIHFSAYSSWSYNEDVSKGFSGGSVMFETVLLKGHPALHLETAQITGRDLLSSEYEVLLPRNITLTVNDVKQKKGCKWYTCDLNFEEKEKFKRSQVTVSSPAERNKGLFDIIQQINSEKSNV